ncbi:MAG: hypothetical protein KDD53_04700, partial [Bdellovibrionales bacterium]|nr:hypothetical protein [Bdellovibrionales bacterium]
KIIHDASRAFLDAHPRLAQHADSLRTLQQLYASALEDAIDHIERKVLKQRSAESVQHPTQFDLSGETLPSNF